MDGVKWKSEINMFTKPYGSTEEEGLSMKQPDSVFPGESSALLLSPKSREAEGPYTCNSAIEKSGFGRYQVRLFLIVG